MFKQKNKPLKFEEPKKYQPLFSDNENSQNVLFRKIGENIPIPMNEKLVNKSVKITIENVDVYFPFQPYDVQEDYMSSVIKTLQHKDNALLQSPTGTGKTLSLLCASLAWLSQYKRETSKLNDEKAKKPFIKIIYASRTHTQLKQVLKELKSTVYEPQISVLGSKDHHCIKSEFSKLKGTQLNQACTKAISGKDQTTLMPQPAKEGNCIFFNKSKISEVAMKHDRKIMDIEEIREFGRKNGVCPYFFERQRKDYADLILMPYNYLLENQFSDIVDVANSIIIFDEAHNVAGVAEEGASYQLSTTQMAEAEKELSILLEVSDHSHVQKNQTTYDQQIGRNKLTVQKMKNFQQSMKCFSQYMLSLRQDKRLTIINQVNNEKGFILESQDIFDMLFTYTRDNSINSFNSTNKENTKEGITQANFEEYIGVGKECLLELQDSKQGQHFEIWVSFVQTINKLYTVSRTFQDNGQDQIPQNKHWIDNPINHYKLCVTLEALQENIVLNLWCLDPGQSFIRLQEKKTHSIILTSGTMTPFSSWESELRIPFKIQKSCGHVIDIQKNLIAGIFKKGQNGCEFNFGFQNRQNNQIYDELGLMLINMSDHIPNGVLVIFSSYSLMNKCKYVWGDKEKSILMRLHEKKLCFWEPKVTSEMDDIFQQYATAARKQKGAIMFAVCRGKVAEGIDFSDELCRAVFLVGIPYPPYQDLKIDLKKKYIDRICNDQSLDQFKKINSKEWYNQQAIRSTNQSIGRVIRHKDDYGAIFLCDTRFEWQNLKCDISSWVQPVLTSWQSFQDGFKSSNEFFSTKKLTITNGLHIKQGITINENADKDDNQQKKRNIEQPPPYGLFLNKLKMALGKK